mmetsp:Transcript_3800/g.10920  ORF Transcript_3800/g.10920 Transcript_3800/m.10920 type:complete len:302 (-) Transcript_3800:221-1126(-)
MLAGATFSDEPTTRTTVLAMTALVAFIIAPVGRASPKRTTSALSTPPHPPPCLGTIVTLPLRKPPPSTICFSTSSLETTSLQVMHVQLESVPCNSMTSLLAAAEWRPSMFCVTTLTLFPKASRSATAECASLGRGLRSSPLSSSSVPQTENHQHPSEAARAPSPRNQSAEGERTRCGLGRAKANHTTRHDRTRTSASAQREMNVLVEALDHGPKHLRLVEKVFIVTVHHRVEPRPDSTRRPEVRNAGTHADTSTREDGDSLRLGQGSCHFLEGFLFGTSLARTRTHRLFPPIPKVCTRSSP